MRAGLSAAAVIVVLAAVGATSAAAGVGSATREAADVLLLGDSVPARLEQIPETAWALEQGLSVRTELAVCRRLLQPSCTFNGVQPSTAYQVVSSLSRVPRVVVLSLGYNDPPSQFADDAAVVMRKLISRGVEHVVWVTLRETRPQWRDVNRIIFGFEHRWPGVVTVADWNALSNGQPWFEDEIHLNTDGALALAKLIRARVLAACGKACLLRARPPLQPLPSGARICLEGAGGDWAAVLATASSARDALALQRRAVAQGFKQSIIVQSTPTVWQIALFGFPTRTAAIDTYLEIKSHGFRATITPNLDKCGDERGSWKAIFGRTTTEAAASKLLARIRAEGFKDGSQIQVGQPGDYAVVVSGIQSTSDLPGFAQEALHAGFIVSFAPS